MKQAKDLVAVLQEADQRVNPKLMELMEMSKSFGGGRSRGRWKSSGRGFGDDGGSYGSKGKFGGRGRGGNSRGGNRYGAGNDRFASSDRSARFTNNDQNEKFGGGFKGNRDVANKFDKYDSRSHYGEQQAGDSYNKGTSDNRGKLDHRAQNQTYGSSYGGNYKSHENYVSNNSNNSNGQSKPYFSTQGYEPQTKRSVHNFDSNSSNYMSGQKYSAPNAPTTENQYPPPTGKVLPARQNVMGNLPTSFGVAAYGSKGNLPQNNHTGFYPHQ